MTVLTRYAYVPKATAVVTCNCASCNGITASVPVEMLAKTTVHRLCELATFPFGPSAGCTVISR